MDNTQWYVAVIYRCGEDMVGMCIKLSGYVQIYYIKDEKPSVCLSVCLHFFLHTRSSVVSP